MAAVYSYPGVYIQEVFGVGSIVGVSTSDTVFIDFFPRGPVRVATRITSFDDFTRQFGGLDSRSEASYAIQQFFLNGGTVAWVVRVIADSSITPALPSANQAQSATCTLQDTSSATAFTATAITLGAWGGATGSSTKLQIGIDQVSVSVNGTQIAYTSNTLFNLVVRLVQPPPSGSSAQPTVLQQEVYRQVSVLPGGEVSGGVQRPNVHDVVNGQSALISMTDTSHTALTFPNPNSNAPSWMQKNDVVNYPQYATWNDFGNGSDGDAPPAPGSTSSNWCNTTTNPPSGNGPAILQSGFSALDRMAPYTFSLMCIPAAAQLANGQAAAVYTTALSYCQTYRAFLLVDVPPTGTVKTVDGLMGSAWYNDQSTPSIPSLFSDHAAAYFPRLQVPDPLNSFNPRSVGASGTVAGIYARIDANRGVWKAPAGTDATLVNATLDAPANGTPINLTDQENGALNPFGINAIRNFPIFGTVLWGARTLNGADAMASQWKYIPVRRLALYIEQSLYQGSKWIVFEPNDEPLWSEIRKTFGAFMQSLFVQGAFQGQSPADAYFVRCDKSTTTQADVDAGVVNILVGFAPLKPAEFVVISIQQIAGQSGT